jgi:hypothetical protein
MLEEKNDNLSQPVNETDGTPEQTTEANENANAMAAEHEEAADEDQVILTQQEAEETPVAKPEAEEVAHEEAIPEADDNETVAEPEDSSVSEQAQQMANEEPEAVEEVAHEEATPEADNGETVAQEEAANEEPEAIEADTTEDSSVSEQAKQTPEVETAEEAAPQEDNTIEAEQVSAEPIDEDTIVELTPEEIADDTMVVEDNSNLNVMETIAETNAEESEDETVRHDIPMQDYDTLSMEDLTGELDKLASNEKVMAVKDHIEEIRKSFMAKYHHFLDEKRDEWHAENPDTTEDFHYDFPLKKRFDQTYSQYRDRKNAHFKNLQGNLENNLKTRLAIVEELKNLINPQENIKDTLKHFNDIRDRWKNAGPIPKDKYNHVWNNYHFHVENFYDYLHLDREARDIDFKHNLEQKQRIIARVEQLTGEPDINKSFRELQDLHKIWKEDIGPVSRDHREEIWNRFSELTKQMHDKREVLFEKMRAGEGDNLEKKKEIIGKIETLAQEKVNSHALWLQQIEKVEALRNEFFATGKVPAEVNEETWTLFKNAVRAFNSLKNSFYKDIKKDQNDNLSRKQALVAKAKELQESTDFAATTPIMKQIQEEWKTIGHVPRKFSDKLWAEFKSACNHYFEKLKDSKTEDNAEETKAFDDKKSYLETLRDFQLIGDHKTDLDAIKKHIENWKGFGKVPFPKRHIEGKFNKILDALFEKLSLSKKETDMMRFSNRVNQLAGSDDTRKLDNEKIFLMRKIDEVQGEIFQLENNIQFFTSKDKNPKKENPMIVEVRKSIEKHKEELATLKDKLKQLRNMTQE